MYRYIFECSVPVQSVRSVLVPTPEIMEMAYFLRKMLMLYQIISKSCFPDAKNENKSTQKIELNQVTYPELPLIIIEAGW